MTATDATTTAPTASGAANPTSSTGRLPHIAALDGLRGVAVGAVLCFHAGFSWASGGFLGVSTFFTLSGFLITSLLLAESDATGTVDLRAFWVRRVRRLLPASLAGMSLALVYATFAADPSARENLFADVVAGLAYSANWWFLASGQSYAELFASPSPLQHFWSLAIEEQFYLLFPALAAATLGRTGARRRHFGLVLVGLAVAAVAVPVLARLDHDVLYYSTPTRAAELLAGALLALGLHHDGLLDRLRSDGRAQLAVQTAGLVALGGLLALVATVAQGDAWLYRGGLAAFSLASAAVILAALLPGGPLDLVLSARPLVLLGGVSYGVYVYHWPLFLWIDERRTGLEGWPLFLVRLAVTLAVATASARWLEQPVRRGATLAGLRPRLLVAPGVAAVAVAAAVVTATAPPPVTDFAGAQERLDALERPADAGGGVPPMTAPPALTDAELVSSDPPPPRLSVYGDSTALMTAFGLEDWVREGGLDATFVPGIARLGCGVGRGGERLRAHDVVEPVAPYCNDWDRTWREKVKVFGPTVVVVQVGPWEAMERRLPGDDTWRAPGDPVYDAWLLDEMTAAVDALSVDGAVVVWLTAPYVNDNVDPNGDFGSAENRDPARMRRLNELIGELPDRRPGQVGVVDLASWLAAEPRDDGWRSDGVHFDDAQDAGAVAREFLGPAVLSTYDAVWRDGVERRREQAAAPSTAPAVASPASGAPTRVLVWGDDTAAPIGAALSDAASPDAGAGAEPAIAVRTVVRAGCGVTRPDVRRLRGETTAVPDECDARTELEDALVSFDPHVVVVVPGAWELADQRVGGESEAFVAPGSGLYDDWARAELGEITDLLHDDDRAVLWVTTPQVRIDGDPAGDVERSARLNQLLTELSASRQRVPFTGIVDLAAHAQTWPGGPTDPAYRPDGVSLSSDGARRVGPWLLQQVQSSLRRLTGVAG